MFRYPRWSKTWGTTVSGVQGAIALEALVSAAFILINSKVGDLNGRKHAYVLGLLRVCNRRGCHDPDPELYSGDHILGHYRRSGRLTAAAGHAVADPRQFRRAAQVKPMPWLAQLPGLQRPLDHWLVVSLPPTCPGELAFCSNLSSSSLC